MADYILVAVAAAFASGLTLFSGFGLGTLLLPLFAVFFPIETAVAATALVHGANNVLKVSLVGRFADLKIVLGFGIPAIIAAIAGAMLLVYFSSLQPAFTWTPLGLDAVVTPIKMVMGVLMFIFALFELLPGLREIRFNQSHFLLGGILSGFFGGLSGHQGALRAAFLVKSGLDTRGFIGTSAVIGFMVDAVRISVYFFLIFLAQGAAGLPRETWPLVITGCLAAFTGLLVGKRFIGKVRIASIQALTGLMLLVIAVLLGSGFL